MIKNESELKLMYSQKQIDERVKELADEINAIFSPDETLYVVCVLKGSILFFSDIVKQLKMPTQLEFIRLNSYRNEEKSSRHFYEVEMTLSDLNNQNVLVVEDIVDTGYTLRFIHNYFNQKYNMKNFKTVALLNKACARVEDVDADLYGFEIEDKFVVGYGLDSCGYYRNLDYIGYFEI